jgi:hypothetical protein
MYGTVKSVDGRYCTVSGCTVAAPQNTSEECMKQGSLGGWQGKGRGQGCMKHQVCCHPAGPTVFVMAGRILVLARGWHIYIHKPVGLAHLLCAVAAEVPLVPRRFSCIYCVLLAVCIFVLPCTFGYCAALPHVCICVAALHHTPPHVTCCFVLCTVAVASAYCRNSGGCIGSFLYASWGSGGGGGETCSRRTLLHCGVQTADVRSPPTCVCTQDSRSCAFPLAVNSRCSALSLCCVVCLHTALSVSTTHSMLCASHTAVCVCTGCIHCAVLFAVSRIWIVCIGAPTCAPSGDGCVYAVERGCVGVLLPWHAVAVLRL